MVAHGDGHTVATVVYCDAAEHGVIFQFNWLPSVNGVNCPSWQLSTVSGHVIISFRARDQHDETNVEVSLCSHHWCYMLETPQWVTRTYWMSYVTYDISAANSQQQNAAAALLQLLRSCQLRHGTER